jgi:hypothetical protein
MSRQRLRQLPQLPSCRSMQQESFGNGLSNQFVLPPEKGRAALTNITHAANARDSHPAAKASSPIKAAPASKSGLSFQSSAAPIKPIAAVANSGPCNNNHGVIGHAQQLKATTPKITPFGTILGGTHMTSGTNACVSASLNAIPSAGRNRPNLPPLKQVSQSTSEFPGHVQGVGTVHVRINMQAAAASGGTLGLKEHHSHPHPHHQSLGKGATTAAPAPPPHEHTPHGRKRPFQVAWHACRAP